MRLLLLLLAVAATVAVNVETINKPVHFARDDSSEEETSCGMVWDEPFGVELPVQNLTGLRSCKKVYPEIAQVRFLSLDTFGGTTFERQYYTPPSCANQTVFEDVGTIYMCGDFAEALGSNSFTYVDQLCTTFVSGPPSHYVTCLGRGQVLYVASPQLNVGEFETVKIANFHVHVHHDHLDLKWEILNDICGEKAEFLISYGEEEILVGENVTEYTVMGATLCTPDLFTLTPVGTDGSPMGDVFPGYCTDHK